MLPRSDFQGYSNGTPVVAEFPTGSTATGTISVVNLAIVHGYRQHLSPACTRPAWRFWGKYLLVANTYSDSISVIDTTTNKVAKTIDLRLPIGVPGGALAYGAGPNSIAVDAKNNVAYVALYNANAIAVLDLNADQFSA